MAWQSARVIWTRSSRGNQIVRQSKGSTVSLKDFESSESEDRVARSHFVRMANTMSYGRSGNGLMVSRVHQLCPSLDDPNQGFECGEIKLISRVSENLRKPKADTVVKNVNRRETL